MIDLRVVRGVNGVEPLTVTHLKHAFNDFYGQAVRQMEPIGQGHVYLILTSEDYYVVKLFADPEQLSWQAKCVTQLAENHVRGIVPFLANQYDSIVNQYEELIFGVMPYIPGKPLSLKHVNQQRDCLRLLAAFHRGGKGIYGRRPSLASQSVIYRQWQERLRQFKQTVGETEPFNGLDGSLLNLVRRHSAEVIEWAELALDKLPQTFLLYLEEQAQWERQIAHRDIVQHNVLVIDNKYYYLIDYDRVDYAPPYVDVVQFMHLALPYLGWQYAAVKELLDVYEEQRPFSPDEKRYLSLFLIYPDDFIREWLGVWQQKPAYHPQAAWHYFQRLDRQWEERRQFVRHCLAVLK